MVVDPDGGVTAAIVWVYCINPAYALERAAFAGGFPVVIHTPAAGFFGIVAVGGGDQYAAGHGVQSVHMFFVKPIVPFGGHHHLNLRHCIGLGTAGAGNANVRYVAALTAGGKNGELVVLALVQSEVIKTPRRDAAGAVKGTHVGPAQGLVAGNDGGDVVIA